MRLLSLSLLLPASVSSTVSSDAVSLRCLACARLLDNLQIGMLPELRQRLEQQKGQRSHYARTATVGDVEEVIERGMEGICR